MHLVRFINKLLGNSLTNKSIFLAKVFWQKSNTFYQRSKYSKLFFYKTYQNNLAEAFIKIVIFQEVQNHCCFTTTCSGSVRILNWWVPKCWFKVLNSQALFLACFELKRGQIIVLSFQNWWVPDPIGQKLMGSGTHWSKIDGFPGTHGTHANGATAINRFL